MKFLEGIEPREYQQKIFKTCTEHNCLVVLPTGIGKTLIALILAIDRITKYPGEKVVFLAPTKPLAEQHLKSFKKYLPDLFGDIQLFTGAVTAIQRKKIWKTADIILSTPQCVANDLKKNLYNLSEVCLLIEDEAHRCMKNYDYNFVAKKYKEQAIHQRILGLTASPGSDAQKIKEICRNLSIEKVELRTRDSEDVSQYLQKLEFEKVLVDFPPEFQEMKHVLLKLFNQYVEELRSRRVLFGPASKIGLIKLQTQMIQGIARGNHNFNYMLGVSACAQAIKIQHALELLETQTLQSFNTYLKKLFGEAAKKKSKGVVRLVTKPEFNFVYMQSNELLAKNQEHPKLGKLIEIIKNEMKIKEDKDNLINKSKSDNFSASAGGWAGKTIPKKKTPKSIVFTQFRESATVIAKNLNELPEVKAKVFVGQAKKAGTGLSQKEQKKIIEDFSEGEINVLVATSLHPEEYIILKNNDKIEIKKIGEFIDSYLKEKKDSSMRINKWQTLSSDGTNLIFKPITHIHKHKAKNNLVKINSKSGFDCLITKDHQLFSFNKEHNFVPSSLEINKFVALGLSAPNIKTKTKIDVLEEISKNCKDENIFGTVHGLTQNKIRILKTHTKILNQIKKTEKSITEISKETKKDYSTILNNLRELKKDNFIYQRRGRKNFKNLSKITPEGRKYLNFLNWFFINVTYHKKKYRFSLTKTISKEHNKFFEQKFNVSYGKINFPRFIELDKYLARFLGFYVSEGHVRKTKHTSGIFLAARKREMQELMKTSIEKGLHLNARRNWRGIAVDSQISYYLIRNVFKAGIGAYNKEVPERIFTASAEIKLEFLKAYFLGDGYLGKDKIVLTTVSRKLVVGLMFLLRSLGIKKISLYKQKNIYRLNISESLPFAKIKEKNEKRRKAYYSLIPTALDSKKAFEKYSNFYLKSDSSLKSRKAGTWKNEICFDYIKDIKKIKKPPFVYDISVKDTKNFIGGTGLFCLHNCIAEEGLDIPEVNTVIFYEPVPSAIRSIQRSGRTARLMKGKLIILITKGTRDETSYFASRSREKRMHKAIGDIKGDLENGSLNLKERQEKL